MDRQAVVDKLNKILEMELAGVVRYTHYSLMVYGFNRIPLVEWLRSQAQESLLHAQEAGERLTDMGEHPSLTLGPLLETHNHDIGAILRESMAHERTTLDEYRALHDLTSGHSIMLEEYSRSMILQEERHLGEVDKMLRSPGDIAAFDPTVS
ncbi:MAG: ferritin-like domain-containing protein [Planctomycetota bacterium]